MCRPLGIVLLLLAFPSLAQNWTQWGGSPLHDSASRVAGRQLDRIEADIVLDPLAEKMETLSGGVLLAHYPVPIVYDDDVIVVKKSGTRDDVRTWETQTWNVTGLRRDDDGVLRQRWSYATDWKPVPWGGPTWEPVYHPAVSGDFVFAPGAGGTLFKLRREDGVVVTRYNPFGDAVDPTIFVAGPPAVDSSGNVYYNAIQLTSAAPWTTDPPGAWLVRIGSDGSMKRATFASLTPNAPAANDQCTATFANAPDIAFPWPPSRDAVAPALRCGPQRPGINVAPAIAPDGTVYTISRAHMNPGYAFLAAANADLSPKWAASMRNRFVDGCDVNLPPSGTPGGCRAGSVVGVDPTDNEPGSGRVTDNATSSPVVTPDGKILYGSYTRYNYSQGHLMMFGADGQFLNAYNWGWDLTPAIYRHDGTYSILLKENHYSAGSYCNDPIWCPGNRGANAWDPESYYITQLDSSLRPEWKFKSTNTQSCERAPDGSLVCASDHPNGFEWCVNAIAVDALGVVYANSEDGYLYAIVQGGRLRDRIFLRQALGAAYTPTSIGPDGKIYTQNDGNLFIVDQRPKRRAVRK